MHLVGLGNSRRNPRILLTEVALDNVLSAGWQASHFYKPTHRLIFDSMRELRESGRNVDPVTLINELRERDRLDECGGSAGLQSLLIATPAIGTAIKHAEIVIGHAERCTIIARTADVADAAFNDDRAALEQAIEDLHRRTSGDYKLPNVTHAWERLRDGANPVEGPRLLQRVDSVGTLYDHASVLLVGPAGAAKTWLALSAVARELVLGRKIAWIDLDNMASTSLLHG